MSDFRCRISGGFGDGRTRWRSSNTVEAQAHFGVTIALPKSEIPERGAVRRSPGTRAAAVATAALLASNRTDAGPLLQLNQRHTLWRKLIISILPIHILFGRRACPGFMDFDQLHTLLEIVRLKSFSN